MPNTINVDYSRPMFSKLLLSQSVKSDHFRLWKTYRGVYVSMSSTVSDNGLMVGLQRGTKYLPSTWEIV